MSDQTSQSPSHRTTPTPSTASGAIPIGGTPSGGAPMASATVAPRPAGPKAAERRSLGRRSVALVRRWARDTFNREQLVSSLRALAWVAPLTLLIWIYAEREQQAISPARFQIVVKSADPYQVATFVTLSDQNVTATLKGPKARLAAVTDKLDPRANGGAVQIVIDGNRAPGQYEIDILAQIQKDYRLDGSGVTVQECQPRQVRVDGDALQEVELVVKPDPQMRFPTPPVFDPPVVKIMAPAAAIRAAKGELFARANLGSLPPGPHSLKSVPLVVEGLDPKTPLRPPTVSATVEVGQADVQSVIASMPVFPIYALDQQQLDRHKLRFDQFLANVPVYGTPEKIRQLEALTLNPRPEAHFKVREVDVGKQRVTAELKYELPEGIRLGDGAPKTITFDLMPNEP